MAAFIASFMFVVLAEMGDKIQLATISLAVEYRNMLSVLMGITLGMVVADGVGIIIGVVLRKHIPEKKIKWLSAAIFVLFGFTGVYKVLSVHISMFYTLMFLAVIRVCTVFCAYNLSGINIRPSISKNFNLL